MVGKTISHSRILEKLGEGGMGVVYKARDTHLDRFVAIKVLPPERVADPERKRRFEQEAKAASALNHPNIIHIYDIDQQDGLDYIAMEHVQGKTLGELIGRKGLKLGDALKYGVQIADALSRAHAAGIIHRDLKPRNIMVDEHGLVKVLDFGLAKLTETAPLGEDESTHTLKPTTEEGTILGTVAYMSPEQAEGKKVDARSDIFSFGVVLYEMVTGRRAFQKESKASTLAAIINQEPAPLSAKIPHDVEKVIKRCLRKDLAHRFQTMADLKVALEELEEESDSGKLAGILGAERKRWRRWPWAAAVAAVLLLATVVFWLGMSPGKPAPVLTRLTSDTGLTTEPDLSPDGKLLAYTSDRADGNLDIWLQELAGGSTIRLTQHPADDTDPAFSRDGSKIAFRSSRDGGGLYVIPVLGGEERLIARDGRRPRFSPDNRYIAYWVGVPANEALSANIFVVSSGGGTPRQLVTDFANARYPVWSPDGQRILFQGARGAQEAADWWVIPIEGGSPIPTGARSVFGGAGLTVYMGPERWIGNQLLFSAGQGDSTNLWRARISPDTWQVDRVLERLTFGTGVEADPSVTADGRLVFASIRGMHHVWSLKGDAVRGNFGGDFQRLVHRASSSGWPALSADGNTLILLVRRAGGLDLLVKDLNTGTERSLRTLPPDVSRPVLKRDGSRAAYSVTESHGRSIYVITLNQGTVEKLCDDCGDATDWSVGGEELLYLDGHSRGLSLLRLARQEKVPLLQHPKYALGQARFSPDHRWIVFSAQVAQDRSRLFIAPYAIGPARTPDGWIPVTDGGSWDDKAEWSPDGNLLYYYSRRDGFGCIWKQPLDPATKHPVGAAAAVAHFHSTRLTLRHIFLPALAMPVARDKIVFTAGEVSANIWMTRAEATH